MADERKDPPVFTFFNEIGIIAQLSQTLLERALPDGLKLAHFGVLNHFARLGGERNPAELARAFQVTKGAMTNTLHRLAAGGLVEIRPDPRDGRGKRVRITKKGLQARDKAIAALAPAMAEVEAAFTARRLRDAVPFLQEVRAYLDTARDASDDEAG